MEQVSKSFLMSRVAKGLSHECFNHSDAGTFDITYIREHAQELGGELGWIALDDVIYHIRATRDTEPARVMQLEKESWENDPGIFVELRKDGEVSHLMVDGHHRALRRAIEGHTRMQVWMIPFSERMRPGAGWIQHPTFTWGDPDFAEKQRCK